MISMVKIAAGRAAWKYLLDGVSDDAAATTGKTSSYYLKGGNPPGVWYGSGLAGLGLLNGAAPRDGGSRRATGGQLEHLFGAGAHPLTGEQLARAYKEKVSLEERIEKRINQLNVTLSDADREHVIEMIVEEEGARRATGSVAGFELVFNPPKSVSTWWALADAGLKDEILAAHHAAIHSTLLILERDVLRTRTGTDGVVQELTRGVVAAGFDHWESREGDPQLHTHLLIANRVQGLDGVWRTLDSRHGLSPAVMTLSQQYDADLMDQLSLRFGVRWTEQSISDDPARYATWIAAQPFKDTQAARATFAHDVAGIDRKNLKWQIEGIPQGLNDLFSSRAKQVRASKDESIQNYVAAHGRQPSKAIILKMRALGALRTRRAKQHHELKGLTKTWRTAAGPLVGDTHKFAARIRTVGLERLGHVGHWSFRADDVSEQRLQQIATVALGDLSSAHAVWSRMNARAAVHRVVQPWTFRDPADRDAVVTAALAHVLDGAIMLTPKRENSTPRLFQLANGESGFHSPLAELFTTHAVFDAETRLLKSGDSIAPALIIDADTLAARLGAVTASGKYLSDDQADAVQQIVLSGRVIDVLVGPAGAGKTTTLEKVRELWEAAHGTGSVRGLAPTAKAASVLAESLGIGTENTAKWLYETGKELHTKQFHMKAGDLVIVDEASLGGTMALDELRAQAEQQGAKLLLVGDWAQLSAVDAGGAFGMLARARETPPELVEIRRFAHKWEAAASTLIRLGKQAGLSPYLEAKRISWGYTDTLIHEAVAGWKNDESAGKQSLLIASTNEVADRLNEIARHWRVEQGHIHGEEVALAHGVAAAGDRIVTRNNNRRLITSHGQFVENNAEWLLTSVNSDGSVTVTGDSGSVILPAEYVAKHVQLSYATTTHRSQGRTVDSTHSVVDASTTRENFYVAITRGRHDNQIYVAVDPPETMEGWTENGDDRSYLDILDSILANSGAELSAHETLVEEAERTGSIKQLAAEYETLAHHATLPHYDDALNTSGLTETQLASVHQSPSFGPLLASLRRADAHGMDTATALPRLIHERPFTEGDDPAAVLHYRVTQWSGKQVATSEPDMIAGLIARVPANADEDMQRALDERATAIQARAETILDRAALGREDWFTALPDSLVGREEEDRCHATVIAAYRDKYAIQDDLRILGSGDGLTATRKSDHRLAQAALAKLESSHSITQTTQRPASDPYRQMSVPAPLPEDRFTPQI